MLRALLLPGLDGTGRLFAPVLPALPPTWRAEAVPYPEAERLGDSDLEVRLGARFDGTDTLVIAESCSGPLAIRLAAEPPPGSPW